MQEAPLECHQRLERNCLQSRNNAEIGIDVVDSLTHRKRGSRVSEYIQITKTRNFELPMFKMQPHCQLKPSVRMVEFVWYGESLVVASNQTMS